MSYSFHQEVGENHDILILDRLSYLGILSLHLREPMRIVEKLAFDSFSLLAELLSIHFRDVELVDGVFDVLIEISDHAGDSKLLFASFRSLLN